MVEAVEGSTMKQSSMSGRTGPSVKGVLAVTEGKEEVLALVGMPPESTGR